MLHTEVEKISTFQKRQRKSIKKNHSEENNEFKDVIFTRLLSMTLMTSLEIVTSLMKKLTQLQHKIFQFYNVSRIFLFFIPPLNNFLFVSLQVPRFK